MGECIKVQEPELRYRLRQMQRGKVDGDLMRDIERVDREQMEKDLHDVLSLSGILGEGEGSP